MPKEPLLESPDFSQSCVPAFWPMAMGAALLKAGGDLYAKNLKFVDEETKIHAELRPMLGTPNRIRLNLRTMAPARLRPAQGIPTQVDAQRSGVSRSILDFGEDVRMMLPRFLVSDQRDPALVPCVQRLLAANGEAAAKAGGDALNALTERERRVLALVALDQSNNEVARSLNISTETVKTHLKNIFAKLDVQQRWQAAELARSLGLLEEQ